ncbi:conserved hypothetical protein [Echinococcus multilocularis]|uniref:Uncharacterized protein n=1 Tax=Echinococcus multilocularis TaxID=6211 RepID=A0A068YBI7_ECHMU|nr:conserved hypothetical protein [Echinococcus multilocularis]
MKHLGCPDVGSTIPHKAAVSKTSDTNDTSTTTTNTTSSNVEAGHPMLESAALESTCKATASVGCCAPDRLWFAVADESASSEVVFILDPGTEAARHAWLHELADIAAMQAQLQLALQNPRRFHFVCSVRRQAKTLSSTDMTSLCTNWSSDEGNAFLSAHSSTTHLVHGDGDENGNVDGNDDQMEGPIHFRGASAPQIEWWKQLSENRSLGRWTESDASPEHTQQMNLLTGVSHDSSVPDIIQTPDDVFLPNLAPSQTSPEDSNYLQLPVDGQRTHFRRRSLSQGDAESPSERSQLSRQLAIHVNTPSPSSLSEQSSICAATVDAIPASVHPPKKKLMAAISSRLRNSGHGLSEILSSFQSNRSASTGHTNANLTQSRRRRLFRWSIVDKTTMNENSKPPPIPPQPLPSQSATPPPLPPPPPPTPHQLPLSPSPSTNQSTEGITASSKSSSPFGMMTPQLLRHKSSNTTAIVDSMGYRKPSASRMFSRLRSSLHIGSSGGDSNTAADSIKRGIATTATTCGMTVVTANRLPNTLASDGI